MGKTAEDLRHDLEQQRESLGRDLVAIGDRVSPGRMVERRRLAVRQSFGRARDAVMGAKDTAADTTQHAASSAQSAVGSAASAVGDAVTSAPQAIQSQTQGNPLAAGLIAFGVGALAGSLLPTTRREEQAVAQVQPALESAASELAEGAQSVADVSQGPRRRGRRAPQGGSHGRSRDGEGRRPGRGADGAGRGSRRPAALGTSERRVGPGSALTRCPEAPTARTPAPPPPEDPNRFGDGEPAPLDEAPEGRTPSDPNETSDASLPPGAA